MYLLSICCQVDCRVGKQPETRDEISFPKSSKSFILVDEKKTLPKTPFTVKSAHLTFNFHHLQRRRDGFTENSGETDAQKALRPRQSVVFFNRGHPCFGFTHNSLVPEMISVFSVAKERICFVQVRHLNIDTEEVYPSPVQTSGVM